jgi:hypothetical protein
VSERHAAVWAAARPYLRARKNDVHVPLSYGCAERLLEAHPEADAEVVLVGILLHDIGWALVDQAAIYRDGFGPGMMESAVRIAHEKEGARMAGELLEGLGYPPAFVAEVTAIIDGHDTRPEALSRNDELVKDADRLWRFSVTGVSVACDWFAMTPGEYADHLSTQVEACFTETARAMARAELTATRRLLRVDALAAVPA